MHKRIGARSLAQVANLSVAPLWYIMLLVNCCRTADNVANWSDIFLFQVKLYVERYVIMPLSTNYVLLWVKEATFGSRTKRRRRKMKARKTFVVLLTMIMIGSLFAGTVSALDTKVTQPEPIFLENVRDYAPAATANGTSYLVDGGRLYAGVEQQWKEISIPSGTIANVVAVGLSTEGETVYLGAANETVLYRSQDGGKTWDRYELNPEAIGGITAIAVDNFQKLIYVGTDTDGAYRLRDVGSSMTINGHLVLDVPVLEIAADSSGAGLAFVRTQWELYRSENMGLSWVKVENLLSMPTAVAVTSIANEIVPATVYVGTTDRGLLRSVDGGHSWQLANEGLNMTPGTRLSIDALAVDPLQPNVLYVSTSYLFGSTTVTQTPAMVAMSSNNAVGWSGLGENVSAGALVDDLMPVSGEAGSVYALSTQSRKPLALGNAPVMMTAVDDNETASVLAFVQENLAWSLSALSALVLLIVAGLDFFNQRGTRNRTPDSRPSSGSALGRLFARNGQ